MRFEFATAVGGLFSAPHGAICAALLPHVMEVNLRALTLRQPESPVLSRFDEVARLLTGDPGAAAEAGVEWVRELCHALAIPALGHYGVTPKAVAALCKSAAEASSMKANPIVLTSEELEDTLLRAIGPP